MERLAASCDICLSAMPCRPTRQRGLLTDISTEELAHVEMISTMMFQLMQDATMDEIIAAGLGGYYTQHGRAGIPGGCQWSPLYVGIFPIHG